MKKLIVAFILFPVLIPSAAADPGALEPEDRVFGLSLIWQEANYNFAFFDQVPELDWDAAYRAFIPEVLAAESTLEYYRTLQRFIALLRDAHTTVRFPRDLIQSGTWSYPWVLITRVDGQAYVRSVGAGLRHRIPAGSIITHIDGTPADEYIQVNVVPFVASSTRHDLFDRAYREALHGHAGSSVEIGFVSPDGRTESLEVYRDRWTREDTWAPDPNVQRPRFSLTWPEDDVALVEITTFEDAGVVDDWLAALPDLRKARALILDIRNNPGGNSNVGWTIASWLTDEPLLTSAWRTREHRAAFKAWGRFDPDRADWAAMNSWFKGGTPRSLSPAEGKRLILPTVVLQDHPTGSAAEDFLVSIEAVPTITTLGRPSAGSTGQPLFLELPGGGTAFICTKRDTFPDGRDFVGVGIIPDIPVEPTVGDVRADRDVMLERALEYLRPRLDP